MLSYAFKILKQNNYETVASEQFDKIQDLFAAILSKGVSRQIKQGLYREYVTNHETLSVLRGKLDINGTIRNQMQQRQKLDCEFDDLSENNLYNQIIKTTMYYLLKSEEVENDNKIALYKCLVFFDKVSLLNPASIKWNRLQYQRNNKNYEMLLNICYFVLDGMLQTTEQGEYKMMSFSEDHLHRLYERFILEYYRYHYPNLSEVKAAEVAWNLSKVDDNTIISYLPTMKTDIFLRMNEKILILDAKYYTHSMTTYYDKSSIHSHNLYQIFTYVKNQDKDNTGNVAGLLVYAKTQEDITPDFVYEIGGNKIGAVTLDLNQEFKNIADQLDTLVKDYLEVQDKTEYCIN